jgi:hypothetical protein
MVMLVLADAFLDTFGGDTIADTRANLDRYVERISRAPEAPMIGRSAAGSSPVAEPEAGPVASGGDD